MKSTLLILSLLAVTFGLTGCALTPAQQESAAVQAGGQAYGAYYLTSHETNGIVDPAILTQYQKNLVGIKNIMSGGMDAYTFQNIVQQVTKSTAVSPGQAAAIGFLNSVNATFVRANSDPLTVQGAQVEAAAQQLAAGLAAAIDQVTGQPFVIPATP
jgi:hypothetical protein